MTFLLNAMGPENVLASQKLFLQLIATKFILSDGHRLAVSVYGDSVEHHISLGVSKDNKEFLASLESLTSLTGPGRLDLAINDVFNTYFNAEKVPVSSNAKVIVLIVSDTLNRSSTFCPSYLQPASVASEIKGGGVRVIMAAVGVNISEDFEQFFESDDEIWHIQDYDELVSAAGNFSMAVCETSGKLKRKVICWFCKSLVPLPLQISCWFCKSLLVSCHLWHKVYVICTTRYQR